MKQTLISCLLCVFFLILSFNVSVVFAYPCEELIFSYNGKIFTYSLRENIKINNVFEIDYEINKLNRFGSTSQRQALLQKLISIGIDKTIAIDYIFPNLSKTISKMEKNINIAPKSATIKTNSNSENVFNISSEVVGLKLNRNKLIDDIINNFLENRPMEFKLPVDKLSPEITKNELQRHTYIRGDFSTNISSSSPDRKHNIKNSLNALNKIEILPNEIFSFNKTVGKRTLENGYRPAKIIVNNEFVEGIGGGVCQVSSTLYNAALLSGLEILEANKHSKPVGYVKSGFDAMVNFGSSDLKFKNNTKEKLTIITNYSSSYARIRIFGENMGNVSYSLTNEICNVVNPVEEIIFDTDMKYIDKVKYTDEYFYLKTATKGMEIYSYRNKYINNQLIETEKLRHDKYQPQNPVKIYGSIIRADQEKSTETICA